VRDYVHSQSWRLLPVVERRLELRRTAEEKNARRRLPPSPRAWPRSAPIDGGAGRQNEGTLLGIEFDTDMPLERRQARIATTRRCRTAGRRSLIRRSEPPDRPP
jgi:hypothetical protein